MPIRTSRTTSTTTPDYADKRQELLERLINITPRPHRMLQSRLQGNYIASDRAPRYIPI